jgi:hypothetical protein
MHDFYEGLFQWIIILGTLSILGIWKLIDILIWVIRLFT